MLGCPIRKSTTHRLFAPDRGLSQLVTSFIASQSQGIRHTPLVTFLLIFIKIDLIKLILACINQYRYNSYCYYCIFFQNVKELCSCQLWPAGMGPLWALLPGIGGSNPQWPSLRRCLSNFLIYLSFKEPLLSEQFVENIGVEPMTSCVQGRRSSQLS